MSADPPPAGYRRGEPGYRDVTAALFAAGLATFAAMYAAQAVLPALAQDFHVTPAVTTLAVSATTGLLALAIIPVSVLSERFGRTRVMTLAALTSAAIGLLVPLAPSMDALIALRGLQGIALAGVPATAMAYLAEEVHRDDLGAAMGRYIAGTTLGGLAGRLAASLTLDVSTWRWALEVAALLTLACTIAFVRRVPASRHHARETIGWRRTSHVLGRHLRSPALLALFATSFVLMGAFVSTYNLIGFYLSRAPFSLPQSVIGLVFLLYLSGTATSAAAGRLADRCGRLQVLVGCEAVMLIGVLTTLVGHLGAVLVGTALLTGGFFGAHAVASGWVGAIARRHRAEASSLYLFAYYLGSSLLGAAAGWAWDRGAWPATATYVAGLVVVGILVAPVVARSADGRPSDRLRPPPASA